MVDGIVHMLGQLLVFALVGLELGLLVGILLAQLLQLFLLPALHVLFLFRGAEGAGQAALRPFELQELLHPAHTVTIFHSDIIAHFYEPSKKSRQVLPLLTLKRRTPPGQPIVARPHQREGPAGSSSDHIAGYLEQSQDCVVCAV